MDEIRSLMYIHMYNFGELGARTRIQFLFLVDFGAHVYFQPTIHRSKKSHRFLTHINAFLRLRRNKAWVGKKLIHFCSFQSFSETYD